MAEYNMGAYRPRPRGEYNDGTQYRYLDIVRFNGCSYINNHLDTVDGYCIGIAPDGEDLSELYWMRITDKGEKGDTADSYLPYAEVSNGVWDYAVSGDKILIPDDAPSTLNILNTYDGCCGIIITKKDLVLPSNSYKSKDFNYINITGVGQYYFYTFTYTNIGSENMYIWHRTVVSKDG